MLPTKYRYISRFRHENIIRKIITDKRGLVFT